jgi:glycosyltransferase involved in cell wall biosynthesis
MTTLTVVINTYDGRAVLPRAISSVLAQDLTDVEVVVADDGSPYEVEEFVATQFPDAGIRVVTQPNAGLSAARNLGMRSGHGDWVLFLDDDDELLPGALRALRELLGPGVAVASGTVEVVPVDSSGAPGDPSLRPPPDLGPEMHHEVANYLAGSFVVSRSLLSDLGGFDEGMRCNHQRELFLRLVPLARSRGLRIVSTTEPVMRMYRRAAADRPRNDPERLQGCLERMLDKHRDQLARNPVELASLQANAAVAAMRNGHGARARSLLRGAVRTRPTSLQNWGRLAVVHVPPLARRMWV